MTFEIYKRARPTRTHCANGHRYFEGSFYLDFRHTATGGDGARVCKICLYERVRNYRLRKGLTAGGRQKYSEHHNGPPRGEKRGSKAAKFNQAPAAGAKGGEGE
jgi:hypothetical protein